METPSRSPESLYHAARISIAKHKRLFGALLTIATLLFVGHVYLSRPSRVLVVEADEGGTEKIVTTSRLVGGVAGRTLDGMSTWTLPTWAYLYYRLTGVDNNKALRKVDDPVLLEFMTVPEDAFSTRDRRKLTHLTKLAEDSHRN